MNRLNDVSLIVIGIIVGLCALGGYVSSLYMGEDDAFIEEISEDIIENYTGISVDLTPSSPEK